VVGLTTARAICKFSLLKENHFDIQKSNEHAYAFANAVFSHDNHHYPYAQCGTPFYSIQSTPFDPSRIAIQGEFGGLGENTTIDQ
jgi:hypothetical protein